MQATADTAELLADKFNETLRPAANTGGARVMGLQVIGADPVTDLQAIVPASWAGERFCVRTGTSDGLYNSENTYRAPADTSRPIAVPHVTQSSHANKLIAMAPDSFAIRIQRAACEDTGPDSPGALALWRGGDGQDSFALFVNSFDADRLVAFPSNGDPVECSAIAADISVAFDKVCNVPFAMDQGDITIRLIPVKDGLRGRTETITIDLQ